MSKENKLNFLEEYESLCEKYKVMIEPCGWHNLILSNVNQKELKYQIKVLSTRLQCAVDV